MMPHRTLLSLSPIYSVALTTKSVDMSKTYTALSRNTLLLTCNTQSSTSLPQLKIPTTPILLLPLEPLPARL